MKTEGYFTVEAALVMLIVLAEMVLVIYLFFFQYDRCLMEQDMGVLIIRGIMMEEEDTQKRMEKLERYIAEQYLQKYLVWERENLDLEIERGILHVGQTGRLSTPDSLWKMTRAYEGHIVSPVVLIRSYRKVTGGK